MIEKTKISKGLAVGMLAVLCCTGLTVKAASEFKELSSKELQDVSYNGKIYSYAIEKEIEAPEEKSDLSSFFEETVNGMKRVDIESETVNVIPKKETTTESKSKTYKKLAEKDESKIDKEIKDGGDTYALTDISWSEEPNMEHVSYTVDYGYRVDKPEPDNSYRYTYKSPVTNKNNTVDLPFVELKTGDTKWVDGFSAIVTFHNLSGQTFDIGNHSYEYDADHISLDASQYKELVGMLGYDTSKYQLSSASWKGKEYTADGVTCRDAVVSGSQYAAAYSALYEADVENGKLYTAVATYSKEKEIETDEADGYVIRATAYYEKNNVWMNIISFVTEHKSTALIGLFLFIIILLGIVVLWKGKKSKEPSNQTDYGENQER